VARAVAGPNDLAVSRDGSTVYVAAGGVIRPGVRGSVPGGGIAVLRRNPHSGALAALPAAQGCITASGVDALVRGSRCRRAPGLEGAMAVAVSADGRNVYALALRQRIVADDSTSGWGVRSGEHVLYSFARNRRSGALRLLGGRAACVTGWVPVAGARCARARLVRHANTLALAPDGRRIYLSAPEGIAVLRRDTATGAISALRGRGACVTRDGRIGGRGPRRCTAAASLGIPMGLTIPADGRSLYVWNLGPSGPRWRGPPAAGMLTFKRTADGALTRLPGPAGCLWDAGYRDPVLTRDCASVPGLPFINAVAAIGVSTLLVGSDRMLELARAPSGALALRRAHAAKMSAALADGSAIFSVDGLSAYGSGWGAVSTRVRSGTGAYEAVTTASGCATQRFGDLSRDPGARSAPTTPPCAAGRAIIGARSARLSHDGHSLYVAARDETGLPGAIAVFAVNP
jgi:hypothetical protein